MAPVVPEHVALIVKQYATKSMGRALLVKQVTRAITVLSSPNPTVSYHSTLC
jgi:hypothetical protein